MKTPSPVGKVFKPLGILVALLAVTAGGIAISPLGSMFGSMVSVTRHHDSLKDREDAHELGALMEGVLRNPSITTEILVRSDDERMPARLRELGASYVSLDRKKGRAQLEFGGGFYHYGYEVQIENPGAYRMICYGENEKDIKELGTFQYARKGEALDGHPH